MEEKQHFKILCVDGGGIKGLYSSQVLAEIEKAHNVCLSDYFDLICGTSTGGIIALGISAGIPMQKIVGFYQDCGPKIFRSNWKSLGVLGNVILGIRQALLRSKYSQKALKSALISVFGNKTISESKNLLCIPAYNLTDGKPRIFKRDYGCLNQDNDKTYVDVALATSAAPTYLPIHNVNKTNYIDGGVYANNPILVGLTEYLFKWTNKGMFDGVDILSISSCDKNYGWSPRKKRLSFFKWRETLFDCYSHGQEKNEMVFLEKLSKSGALNFDLNIVRIENEKLSGNQEQIISMDNASSRALDILMSKGKSTGACNKDRDEVKAFFKTKKIINL